VHETTTVPGASWKPTSGVEDGVGVGSGDFVGEAACDDVRLRVCVGDRDLVWDTEMRDGDCVAEGAPTVSDWDGERVPVVETVGERVPVGEAEGGGGTVADWERERGEGVEEGVEEGERVGAGVTRPEQM
jgi:hypothetical protein